MTAWNAAPPARCSILLFHRLTTWLAPVLVFTMEEVWLERFPGDQQLDPPDRHARHPRRLA